jgi:hypothetical protein
VMCMYICMKYISFIERDPLGERTKVKPF